MATSGTFRAPYGPYGNLNLRLDWRRVETDIAGNRSKIRLTLIFEYSGPGVYWSASKTGNLHGQSFTYSGGYSGTGNKTLKTRDVWVNHNSDGTKTQRFSATFNVAITFAGSSLNSMTVSGDAIIDRIPRASDFTAFSLSNTTLDHNKSNTVTYTLGRKDSSFSHRMTLKLGGTTIKSWSDSGTGSRTQALTSAEVNKIIAGRPNHTSGTLTLTMQTRSGSRNIGSSVSRTRTFNISTNVAPSASGIKVSIHGSGRDSVINRYVQGITRVTSSFTRSAGYGAKVSSSTIVVRRVSGGANSQTISGNSGTTANPVNLSGTYEAIGTVRDSRGRTATSRITFTVQAYKPPSITTFTASRNSSNPTTVDIRRSGSFSNLGGLNEARVLIQRRQRSGTTWTTVQDVTWSQSGSINQTFSSTGNSEAKSYEFRFTLSDDFGNKSTSSINVGTSFIELTIARGKGVGIGKVWEKGSLDVEGEIYLKGRLEGQGPFQVAGVQTSHTNLYASHEPGGEFRVVTDKNVPGSDGWGDKNYGRIGVKTIVFKDGNRRISMGEGIIDSSHELIIQGSSYNDGAILGLRADSNGAQIFSPSIYNRTASSSANVNVSSFGTLRRVSSAEKYKINIQELDEGLEFKLLDLTPSKWFDKANTEEFSRYLTLKEYGLCDETYLLRNDISDMKFYYGFTAEDLEDKGLGMFVEYVDGEKESIYYDRLWILLIPIVKDLKQRVESLENTVYEQEVEINELKDQMGQMQKQLDQLIGEMRGV